MKTTLINEICDLMNEHLTDEQNHGQTFRKYFVSLISLTTPALFPNRHSRRT